MFFRLKVLLTPTLLFALLLSIFLTCPFNDLKAQVKKDSVVTEPKHSPRKATIMSAVLPGLGQAYNKKYWKIPIIYGGLAGLGYLIKTNNDYYKTYRDAYTELYNKTTDSDKTNDGDTYGPRKYSLSDVKIIKDAARQDRDLSIIVSVMVYVLNILDANVDAHLFYFNVSESLSMRMQPSYNYSVTGGTPYTSLSLTLDLKYQTKKTFTNLNTY